MHKALKSRPGKPLRGRRITCVDGSGTWPLPAMSARLRRIFFPCHPRPEHCCYRSPGPHSSRALNVQEEFVIPKAQFRVLLLRRLRMPLPLAPRHCHCRGQLDAWGDHRNPTCPCLPRGGRPCRPERSSSRHERPYPGARRQAHRGGVQWLALLAWCATCH